MNERDIKQLRQAMERLLITARYQHGLALVQRNQTWRGHTSLTAEPLATGFDAICESCGNINQAEFELATAYARGRVESQSAMHSEVAPLPD